MFLFIATKMDGVCEATFSSCSYSCCHRPLLSFLVFAAGIFVVVVVIY